jgi:hypothetical protein
MPVCIKYFFTGLFCLEGRIHTATHSFVTRDLIISVDGLGSIELAGYDVVLRV